MPNDMSTQSLIDKIAAEIGCPVRLLCCATTESETRSAVHDANADNDFVRSTVAAALAEPSATDWVNDERTQAVLRFSESELIHWSTNPSTSQLSIRLAQTILDQHHLQTTVTEQATEIESLTTQVIHDFEELALLRSLAESMSLRTDLETPSDIATRFTGPLLEGLGAQSLAAILVEDSLTVDEPSDQQEVIWTGPRLLNDSAVHELLVKHHAAARVQPIVLNHLTLPSEHAGTGIEELVIIECRSESRLHGWLMALNRLDDGNSDVAWAQHGFTTVQAALMSTATNQLAAQLNNARLFRQKENLFTDVVRALVNAVEARDPYTCGHSERVASFARCLSSLIGLPPADSERIYLTGLLHDVGKIAIPDGVLQKPGRLDDQERAIIETHTDAGWRILHQLDALKNVLPGVLYHHEHYNGQGYPDGLSGDDIPLEGRILAVCDAFDAMTSDRPYRDGMPIEKACDILRGGAGSYWDPDMIEAFVSNIDTINAIRLSHKPREVPVRTKPLTPAASTALA